ncbi:NADH-quinone oxidoreductase subunit N [Microbulbifer rhizosphaerae]|uniref:NADH-quinone oxidoreductase subunit N n=1 Tax=Microbulbifer rhizosphaerae TaxID=1562603 RepID=A0A7W4WG46_9GAMM|nr:NADH-quinone oxidoreductase subunit N [Microbulbifer rhizosphaerae]MBB3063006.1 NADH-quinone oxidoreductase subunit N [Microbulbifer rhizosphaerae]
MSTQELFAILPLLVLSAGIVILLLQVSFIRGHRAALATTLAVLVSACVACFAVAGQVSRGPGSIGVTGLLLVDHYALFFCLLLLFSAIAVAVLGFNYLKHRSDSTSYPEEFYILLLLMMLGASTLVFASHFASFFLALELMSLSLYPLLGFAVSGDLSPERDQLLSLESGLKYLLLSALATALGLFGIALIYAASGALDFSGIAVAARQFGQESPLMLAGLALLLIAMAFKLSLVPFHIWTPDVYQGAPTPVTALIATVGKGAVVALLLRFFAGVDLFALPSLTTLLAFMAVASMLIGNLLALLQGNIKRLLAYSSIAHIGYLFVAFLMGNSAFGIEAVAYYLVAYVVTTLGAFAVVSLVADSALAHTPGGGHPIADTASDPFHRDYYRGLFWRSPWLAGCLAAMLLSLAGIPLTIGFVGKFYIFAAGVQGQMWLLLAAVILGSALGLYYYLRLLLVMVQREEPSSSGASGAIQLAISGRLLMFSLTAVLLVFGIFPQILINWINAL